MSRKLLSLGAITTVALIGAGGSYSLAANGKTGPKRSSSSAPGTLPPKASSRPTKSSSAPGTLPPKASSRPTKSSSAPGTLPPRGSSW
jgi:hypothetical protein